MKFNIEPVGRVPEIWWEVYRAEHVNDLSQRYYYTQPTAMDAAHRFAETQLGGEPGTVANVEVSAHGQDFGGVARFKVTQLEEEESKT